MLRPNYLSLILLCGVAFAAPRAFPISRVGNSVIADPELGFQAQIPPSFFDVRNLGDGALRLTAPLAGGVFFGPRVTTNATLDLYRLATEYPALPDTSRDGTLAYYQGLGATWTLLQTPEPCVLALSAVNGATTTTVLSWGERKGVVIVGAPQAQVQAALAQLIGSLTLEGGRCVWK